MKTCAKCKKIKEDDCFYKNKRFSDGLHTYCKSCWSSYCSTEERKRKRNSTSLKNERNTKRRDYLRAWGFKRRYGITVEQYNEMLNSQSGKCLICKKDNSLCHNGLRVDHDHRNGKIRGLICHECNVTIGLIKEDIVVLKEMIRYLEKNNINA